MTATQITGVVLAAGRSNRLGTPKQLLPYRDTTVLGATLDVARQAGFDQLILTLGGAASAVRAAMALDGTDVVVVEDVERGCAASLRVALARVHPRATGIVLMLGDQPQVAPATLRRIIDVGPATEIMVCRYADGVGHPFWFSRTVFGELARLHGEQDRNQHRAVFDAKGKEARGTGNAAATVAAQLHEVGERTRVTVDTDLKIVGKLAQFGSGMLQQVSEKLLGQFVDSLEAELAAQSSESPQGTPPATEAAPIDLLQLADGGQLKKYGSALLAALTVLLLIWVLRRRR